MSIQSGAPSSRHMKKTLYLNRDYSIENISEIKALIEENDYDCIDFSRVKVDEYVKIVLENYNKNLVFNDNVENASYFDYLYASLMDSVTYFVNLAKFSKILFKGCRYQFQNKYFYNDVLTNIYSMGSDSIIVIAILAMAFGVNLGYQTALQLRAFGAEIYSVNILLISLFKGLGLFVALVVLVAKFGSGLIAKVGFMKITDEWNALTLMNIEPEVFLLKSKIIAFVVLVPFCSYLAIFFGTIGGYIVFYKSLNANMKLIINLANLDVRIFFAPLIKGVFIGALLGIVISYEAFNVEKSSDNILLALSKGMVRCIILCLIFEVIMSVGLGL